MSHRIIRMFAGVSARVRSRGRAVAATRRSRRHAGGNCAGRFRAAHPRARSPASSPATSRATTQKRSWQKRLRRLRRLPEEIHQRAAGARRAAHQGVERRDQRVQRRREGLQRQIEKAKGQLSARARADRVARVERRLRRAPSRCSARAAEASPDVIAQVLLEGFDRHYALFRECARAAKRYFEAGNWLAIGHVARDRIDFYDRRVAETVERIEREFRSAALGQRRRRAVGARQAALHRPARRPSAAGVRRDVLQHRLVASSCTGRISTIASCSSARAVSTEYLDADAPSYRSYYPRRARPARTR